MKCHVILPFLLFLQESSTSHVTGTLVTMTTLLTTTPALQCQQCREYSGPPISKARQENLQTCDEEVMRTCGHNDTICYDLRVSYSGKRGNSTLHEMDCGTSAMSCEPYREIARMSECTVTRCEDECVTEMVNTAVSYLPARGVVLRVVVIAILVSVL